MRCTIRDLLWMTLGAALAAGWFIDQSRLRSMNTDLRARDEERVKEMATWSDRAFARSAVFQKIFQSEGYAFGMGSSSKTTRIVAPDGRRWEIGANNFVEAFPADPAFRPVISPSP
jgi:hypothetical protein